MKCSLVAAVAVSLLGVQANAQSVPSPTEVAARWKTYLSDTSFTYYRGPTVSRDGSNATVWKVSIPTPSMSKIGVPATYEKATYDCAGKRKKIVEFHGFKADGSPHSNPGNIVKLDHWARVLSASDTALHAAVCAT
ncbi:hypothetical protein K9B35_00375 [Sphingomonas sp. R647]|uniref:hypothetical protein n=1 Tax=Sphingomonas sp. R647 TaxID=2875233 RepID=UPI001CD5F19B|nr:hypothetical protein [Sphingomonas sp. R647]MCA1196410.1 hypothetical protein [Sphingomonas sp. R647]